MNVGVASVDAAKKTIAFRTERRAEGPTVSVADAAKITINGKAAKLADVAENTRATLTFSLDKKTVLVLHVGEQRRDGERPPVRDGERPGVDRAGMTKGLIVDFDAAKGTINLLIGQDGDATLHTLSVGKDAKIKLFYGERPFSDLTLAQLSKPLQANVKVADDKKSATAISIDAPTVRGVVKSVDAAKKRITIIEGRVGEKTYTVDDNAIIRGLRQDGAGLADVTAGANVLLSLTPNRQRAIGVAIVPVRRGNGVRE